MTETHGAAPTLASLPDGGPHPYHLVSPSPWPLVAAFGAGTLATGTVLFMHGYGAWLLFIGLLIVVGTMAAWWRDVLIESVRQHAHTPIVKIGLRYGMALFIASEVMFFVAFFWAFFASSLFPAGGTWPPKGIAPIDPFHLPFTMTLILLLSGTTVTWAHHEIRAGRNAVAAQALALTVLLGISFSGFQIYEYAHAAFGFREGIFPSTFYMATGFHGFHVIVGTIFLTVCLWRTIRGDFTPQSHFGFEAASWYWHFVDAVWLFLFTAIYWWGSGQ